MVHQCVHCGKIFPAGSKAIIEGCDSCGGHFFFYIREDKLKQIQEEQQVTEMTKQDKLQIEKDIREIAGIEKEEIPIILDFEAIKVSGPGKYEIDLVKLFSKDKPLIYKMEEGKYIIDLTVGFPKEKS
jgi:predicted  nucleic acid-binding Zn-ribbon protein